MMHNLENLMKRVHAAEKSMAKSLAETFPVGSEVAVQISPRQKYWSRATVVGHNGQGYVLVRLEKAKKFSRNAARDVFFTRVTVCPF